MRINLKLPANGKRLIYDLTSFGLPEVPYLAAQNLPFTALALPTHIHKNRMEINHILKGERIYRVGDRDYRLRGSEVFVTWPNEVHGSGSSLHGRGLHFWMQLLLPTPDRSFLGLKPDLARPLLEALWNLPRRHFRASPEMRGFYSRILFLCRMRPSALTTVRLSALVTEWLLEVITASGEPLENNITPDIARVLETLAEKNSRHYSVKEMAQLACLSESHFKNKFISQVGIPPGEFLQRRRLEMAIGLLTRGHSITSVAHDLEFSSSQHFSTAFKKFFGKSPLLWLREMHDGNSSLTRETGMERKADADGLRPWLDEEGRLHGHICDDPPWRT